MSSEQHYKDLFFDARKEITQLKAELARERLAVDFYADLDLWQGKRDALGLPSKLNIVANVDLGDMDSSAIYNPQIGGKLARETVKAREVKL